MVEMGQIPIQQDLMMMPLDSVMEYPMKVSADSPGEVEASDGFRYRIKCDVDGKSISASEWLCTKIGEEIGIAAPTPSLIKMQDGSLVFGSRRVSGVADALETQTFLLTTSSPNLGSPVAGLQRIISNVYAFDLFFNNVDRHLGNYLSVQETGQRRIFAIDYSRSLFYGWPLNAFPAANENTIRFGRMLREKHSFDQVAADSILSALGALPTSVVEGFINRMPVTWLPLPLRTEFLDWWSNGGRGQRILNLREGLYNGQLL